MSFLLKESSLALPANARIFGFDGMVLSPIICQINVPLKILKHAFSGLFVLVRFRFVSSLQRRVARHHVSVIRDMIEKQSSQPFNVISPISMKFARHSKPAHQLLLVYF
jgi:hypothetical protein